MLADMVKPVVVTLDAAGATSKVGAVRSAEWVPPVVKPMAMALGVVAVSWMPVPVPFRSSLSVPVPVMPLTLTV